jgi:hypothetical protein
MYDDAHSGTWFRGRSCPNFMSSLCQLRELPRRRYWRLDVVVKQLERRGGRSRSNIARVAQEEEEETRNLVDRGESASSIHTGN